MSALTPDGHAYNGEDESRHPEDCHAVDAATKLAEMLRLILPLAKGYAYEHNVGSNRAYVSAAEGWLREWDAGWNVRMPDPQSLQPGAHVQAKGISDPLQRECFEGWLGVVVQAHEEWGVLVRFSTGDQTWLRSTDVIEIDGPEEHASEIPENGGIHV